MDRALVALSVAFSSVAVGCSAPLVPEGEAGATGSSAAVILFERTVSAGENARAEAVARFVRMRSGTVDESALRLVGAATDFPSLGSCTVVSGEASPATASPLAATGHASSARAVELLDIGNLAVEAKGASVWLQPRQLPDIVDLVSGVVYSLRAQDPEVLPSGVPYLLRATGRPDLDVTPFQVAAEAPRELDEVFVGGEDARRIDGVTLAAGTSAIDLSWAAPSAAASGAGDDLFYVDATTSRPADETAPLRTTRCLFPDTGTAALPASVAAGEGVIVLHRVHRESFQARGIDAGEVRFDFARSVVFHGAPVSARSSER